MINNIFGVGLGLFVIIALWIFAGFIFLISLRVEKRIGVIILVVAAIITAILINVPRTEQYQIFNENKLYDQFFLWRLLLLIFMLISAVIGFIGYIKFGLMDIIRPQKIKNWIL